MKEQEKDFKTVLTENIGKIAVDGSIAAIAMNEIISAHISDRDKFAIGFINWIFEQGYFLNNPLDELLEKYKEYLFHSQKQTQG